MYKAIQKIGEYEIGEEVPADKAEAWLKRYKFPPVEKVDEKGEKPSEEKAEDKKPETSNVMLDDYLGRNTNVVRKNIEEDDLSQEQLKNLLKLEKSDKNRRVVIKDIERKLNKLEG